MLPVSGLLRRARRMVLRKGYLTNPGDGESGGAESRHALEHSVPALRDVSAYCPFALFRFRRPPSNCEGAVCRLFKEPKTFFEGLRGACDALLQGCGSCSAPCCIPCAGAGLVSRARHTLNFCVYVAHEDLATKKSQWLTNFM